jgi:hypothetical protein
VSPFLGVFFHLWIIYINPSFIHSYKMVKKSDRIPPKSFQNGLSSKHSIMLLTSFETFGNSFRWELSHV